MAPDSQSLKSKSSDFEDPSTWDLLFQGTLIKSWRIDWSTDELAGRQAIVLLVWNERGLQGKGVGLLDGPALLGGFHIKGGSGMWWSRSLSSCQVSLAKIQDWLIAPHCLPARPVLSFKYFSGSPRLQGLKRGAYLEPTKDIPHFEMPGDDWLYFYTHHFLAKKLNK